MRAHRTLPLFLFFAAVLAGIPAAALGEPIGWQDQRMAAFQLPGRSMPMLRLLSRNHDAGRGDSEDVFRLGRDITVRSGRAYLFQSRSEGFPEARMSGTLDGKGFHLILSWPP